MPEMVPTQMAILKRIRLCATPNWQQLG